MMTAMHDGAGTHRLPWTALAAGAAALVFGLAACRQATPTPSPTPASDGELPLLRLERVAVEEPLEGLTGMTSLDDGTGRVLLLEQQGRVLATVPGDAPLQVSTFLDIRDRVHTGGLEEGLLAVTPHPDFPATPQVFVYYSASPPRRTVLSRFSLCPDDSSRACPDSEQVVLEVAQPYANHNGGQLAFGADGYLYLGLGDGGGAGDPHGNGQDPGTLLGSIIRIDVDVPEGQGYAIPPDNPFVDDPAARDEVWAYGFRNPWRFSFDPATGRLWVADVGQNRWEEVNVVEGGGNYGWNIMEGSDCFPEGAACDPSGLEPPIFTYSIRGRRECAIIGGPVSRGQALPALEGVYLFGDFCSGRIWGLRYDGEAVTAHRELANTGLSITSFGQDAQGRLYVLTARGEVYRLAPEG